LKAPFASLVDASWACQTGNQNVQLREDRAESTILTLDIPDAHLQDEELCYMGDNEDEGMEPDT
jgi:hypothetical protein